MATVPPAAKEWNSTCWACWEDLPICLISYFAPCYTYGQNVDALKGGGYQGPCMTYCFVGVCCGCPCLIAPATRKEIRDKYGLVEGPMSDMLIHFPCCSACAVCQEAREIKKQRGF